MLWRTQRPHRSSAPRQQASWQSSRTQSRCPWWCHHHSRHSHLHPDLRQRHRQQRSPPHCLRRCRYRYLRWPAHLRRPSQPGPRPRQCPRRRRPTSGQASFQKPWQKPGTPPDRAWLRHGQSLHDDATRRAGSRPQTYPFVSYCLNLGHCPAAAPRHCAHCARVPPSGSPFPPEPNAYRRHAPRPRTRWEAIRLNLTDPGAPSDLRRDHPEPRGITVTGTAGDLHPDSPKRAGKPRIRASPHHHLGHRLLLSVWYHAKRPRTQAKPKVKAMVSDRKSCRRTLQEQPVSKLCQITGLIQHFVTISAIFENQRLIYLRF